MKVRLLPNHWLLCNDKILIMHNTPNTSSAILNAPRRKNHKRPIFVIDTITYRGSNVVFEYTRNGVSTAGTINFTDLIKFAVSHYGMNQASPDNYDFICEATNDIYDLVEAYLIQSAAAEMPAILFN